MDEPNIKSQCNGETPDEATLDKDRGHYQINGSKPKECNEFIAKYTKHDDERDSPVDRVQFEGLDDNDSICSVESEKLPPIPDGGWGWVVVAAAFMVSACADGLAFSFGLLHEQFTEYFQATQSETSMIGSLFIASPLLAGPIMSALVDRYGCRIMTIIAGIISTLGFLLAAVSDSVAMVCLTFGFISGSAMGILYVTAVVSVAFWFEKKRNFAVSLASCGIGFGTLVYSPLTHYFLQIYAWRGTVILLAGTLLNMCVCGALMRNPEWLKIKQKKERSLSKQSSRRSSSAGSNSSRSLFESIYLDADEINDLLKSGKSPEYILATLTSSIAEAEKLEKTTQMNADQKVRRMHSAIHLPTFVQHNEQVPQEVIENLKQNKRLYNIVLHNYPDLLVRRRSDVNLNAESSTTELTNVPLEIKAKKQNTDEKEAKPEKDKQNKDEKKDNKKPTQESKVPPQQRNWLRQISVNRHYLQNIPLHRNTMMHRGAMLTTTGYRLRASSLPDMYRNSMWSLASESDDEMNWFDRVWHTIKRTFDFRMFTEFHFLMFNLSSLILSVWFIVPYFFLKSYMTSVNMDGGENMSVVIGIASSIGIVSLGWAGDQPWINVTKTYAACLIICGLSVAAYPLVITSYWGLVITSAIFGLSFASSYSYTPAILMELMPIDRFTVAYGLILLSQGIGHLVGPPIGGMLCDLTGTWDLTFYMGGVWLVISGICVGVIPYTKDIRMCGTAPLLKESEMAESKQDNGVPV